MAATTQRANQFREAKGLRQEQLAELAGVGRATVHRIERVRTTGIDFATLERIADALGVNAAVLVTHERAQEPQNGGRGR